MTTPWITTITGRDHYLTSPAALLYRNAPSIGEVAHALALINRFTGHTKRPYSVAEHSLLVCDIVRAHGLPASAQLAALLHDAHEAMVGDVGTMHKQALGIAWLELENLHAHLVREAFGIRTASQAYRAAIKAADLRALATERRDLTGYDAATCRTWPVLDTPDAEVQPLQSIDLMAEPRCAMTWQHHRDAFVRQYEQLTATQPALDEPTAKAMA